MRGAKQRRYNDRITLRTDTVHGTCWLDETEARLNAIAPGWHFLATYLIAYIDRPLLIVPCISDDALSPKEALHRRGRGFVLALSAKNEAGTGYHGPWQGTADAFLVHALAQVMLVCQGLDDETPFTGARSHWRSPTDFLAVTLTNIFRSEADPAAILRGSASDDDFVPLPGDPATFHTDHRDLFLRVLRRREHVFWHLAQAHYAAFNPFKDIVMNLSPHELCRSNKQTRYPGPLARAA
ncbi:hypothetical protein [Sagittula stellata]|uniref:Uncharacterized protein n=1 Tax=Sagittula stellata (strain ATCC 700073 / DSM 11524 / E-37) TaxID=388399 RepID=A3K152_SAGS3|nr:hypothetical protein [Sagittula stellata]EBA09517.1 hypothetical protein SSE37_24784 [Sagittula stellata E-37]